MPVVHEGDQMPGWCEMESFRLIPLDEGDTISLPKTGKKEEIIVCRGLVQAEFSGATFQLNQGQKLDLDAPDGPGFHLKAVTGPALVFHAAGKWESVTSSGIFPVFPGEPPVNQTPHDYPKTTGFDNHYHDCDEYWIFFQGCCRVVSEKRFYDVEPGDCVITGMGWHHDVQSLLGDEAAAAVWFEGTLEGKKRIGHLWEPVHGKAEPMRDRV